MVWYISVPRPLPPSHYFLSDRKDMAGKDIVTGTLHEAPTRDYGIYLVPYVFTYQLEILLFVSPASLVVREDRCMVAYHEIKNKNDGEEKDSGWQGSAE